MLEQQLANIFSPQDFKDTQTSVIAVSGGSDSLALLFLMQAYNKLYLGNKLNLVAATVDHQLRPESTEEALWVKKLCQKHNITHHTLQWTAKKPEMGLSAAARLARYKLLYDCAKNYKNPILLTGHTLNDQVETFLMRQKRNSWRGLASMARKSLLFKKIYLLRPLLNITKDELRNYLKLLSQNWVEDPTNYNTKYERAFTRQTIGTITPVQKSLWLEKIQQQQLARINLNQKTVELLKTIHPYFIGEILQFTQFPVPYDSAEAKFLLSLLATIIGGASYLPQAKQIETFTTLFAKQKLLLRYNICQTVIEKKSTMWRMWRESRQIPNIICAAGKSVIWDKRYKIQNNSNDIIILRNAKPEEIKTVTYPNKLNLYYYQSSLIIEKAGKTSLPFLNLPLAATPQKKIYTAPEFKQIKIQSHIAIYSWLISGFDLELYNNLETKFNFSPYAL